jgi:hypothetical protein
MPDSTQQPQAQPTPASLAPQPNRILAEPGPEPMTDAERQQWAALELSFLAQLKQTHANAAARCLHCTRPAVTA